MTMAGICAACGNTLPYHRTNCSLGQRETQRGPQAWHEVTEERYDEMLGVLPPELMTGLGFLVGEPSSHRTCTISGNVAADYQAFARIGERYFGATQCMTKREFNRLTAADVLGTVQP